MEGTGTDNSTCLELALEGERLCKTGDCRSGVAFFEAAIQAGTDDLKTLSAIYSQLGNAYFYLGDYAKAMNFHKHDLTLARTMGDKLGEAKASGNLGNTLKVMGRYDEAILCCKRHLDITTQLGDKVGQARALYNLGNAFHAKGKYIGRNGPQDPGEYSEETRTCLIQAVEYYERNLEMTRESGDRCAEGRACGNLGNVHYLLGDFEAAISFHEKRLEIAKEYGDKNAQRRAYTNLGNAHVFSGNFEIAASQYKKSLLLSQELGDQAVEAQACYSLGNTYTLIRDFKKAIEYHSRHLQIAQQLHDKVGEGRAFWSLGNAYSALGEHRLALSYAKKHLLVSNELGDSFGQQTAETNVADLRKVLGLSPEDDAKLSPGEEKKFFTNRRKSMEEMNLIRMTPEASSSAAGKRTQRSMSVGQVLLQKQAGKLNTSGMSDVLNASKGSEAEDEEEEEQDDFFDMLSRLQTERMNDQRCSMPDGSNSLPAGKAHLVSQSSLQHQNYMRLAGNKENKDKKAKTFPARANSLPASCLPPKSGDFDTANATDDLLDMIWGMQSKRMDEQRASLPEADSPSPDDKFFDMLIRCQSTRLEDQRSLLPEEVASANASKRGTTIPDEDFFSLLARFQESRMDDQRADIKDKNRNRIN